MKKFTIVNLMIVSALILGACGTSNNVVSKRLISKRKYNKGFHINKGGGFGIQRDAVAEDKEETASGEWTAAQPEELKATPAENPVKKLVKSQREEPVAQQPMVEPSVEDKAMLDNNDAAAEIHSEEAGTTAPIEANSVRKQLKEQKKALKSTKKSKKKNKNNNSSDDDLIFILAVIFAILIPPLGVLIYTNIDWTKVLIALLLSILFFLPGMIYALLVVFDVI